MSCDPTDLVIPRPRGYPSRSAAVVIHPGAAAASRRWPAERFVAVAAALHRAGHEVVVTGDSDEIALARSMVAPAGLPESAVLAGRLGLLGLVALVSDCRLLISGDTGVAHIATATETPSVVLFGPTPPSRRGPRGDGRHIALWVGNEGDPHADRPDPGLLQIPVRMVLDACHSLLGAGV
jgi:ADP-heptose:LPS heptosyltransferase